MIAYVRYTTPQHLFSLTEQKTVSHMNSHAIYRNNCTSSGLINFSCYYIASAITLPVAHATNHTQPHVIGYAN